MSSMIDPNFKPASPSLMGRQHFQVAYVTNDLAKAQDIMGQEYGIKQFFQLNDVPLPFGGHIDIALAWAGNVNIELIHATGNPDSFYETHLPRKGGFEIAHHHFGYLIPDKQAWSDLEQEVAQSGKEIVWQGEDPNGLSFIYVNAEELGHYLEYIRPDQGWIDLFASLPRY